MSLHFLIFFVDTLGNTRVITQNALQTFQTEMRRVMKDPYKVGSSCLSLLLAARNSTC
jgi:nuclear GTP-binding protein